MHCDDFVGKFKNSWTYLKENVKIELKKISQNFVAIYILKINIFILLKKYLEMIIKIYKCFFFKIIKLYSHNLENKIIGYMRFVAQIY
jgi:hypothetical protein